MRSELETFLRNGHETTSKSNCLGFVFHQLGICPVEHYVDTVPLETIGKGLSRFGLQLQILRYNSPEADAILQIIKGGHKIEHGAFICSRKPFRLSQRPGFNTDIYKPVGLIETFGLLDALFGQSLSEQLVGIKIIKDHQDNQGNR